MTTLVPAQPEEQAQVPRTPRGFAGRAGLATVDQALAGGANLLLALVAAHVLGAADFGRFTLIVLLGLFAQALMFSLVSVPALVHPEDVDSRVGTILATAVMTAAVPALLSLGVGAALWPSGQPLGPACVVFGAGLPGLLLLGVGRFLALGQQHPEVAVVLDATWIALTTGAYAFVLLTDRASLWVLVAGWCGSATVASLLVFARYGVPRPSDFTLDWARERWSFTWPSLVSGLLANAGAVAMTVLAAAVSSPVAVAALRTSILLGRPASTAQLAIGATMSADVARERPENARVQRLQLRAMGAAVVIALANMVALLALPDAVGRLLLGNVWSLVEPLLLATGLAVLVQALQAGVRAALVGRRRARLTMVTDLVATFALIVGVVVGSALGGAAGAVWGMVAGQAVATVAWWLVFTDHLRRTRVLRRTSGRVTFRSSRGGGRHRGPTLRATAP